MLVVFVLFPKLTNISSIAATCNTFSHEEAEEWIQNGEKPPYFALFRYSRNQTRSMGRLQCFVSCLVTIGTKCGRYEMHNRATATGSSDIIIRQAAKCVVGTLRQR